jgi:hypothetical protein
MTARRIQPLYTEAPVGQQLIDIGGIIVRMRIAPGRAPNVRKSVRRGDRQEFGRFVL